MPIDSESVTDTSPMVSDRRVPWMMRESMSRPTGSVPSRNLALPPACQNGGASVASRNCWIGECGATTSAKMATSSISTTTARPITAPRFWRK
jgi:hypothetical protein